jgi:hypothetical protein
MSWSRYFGRLKVRWGYYPANYYRFGLTYYPDARMLELFIGKYGLTLWYRG